MNIANRLLTCTFALALVGCESYQDTMRSLNSSMGAIQIRDIQQANSLREMLPGYLGLSDDSIRVEAGSGVVHVTILEVGASSNRQDITAKIQVLQAKNPKMEPIKLNFVD
jgi:hypothetical protein